MSLKLLSIVLFLLSLSVLMGCVEDVEPNMVWKGNLLGVDVSSGRTVITLSTEYGNLTKIWVHEYPFMKDLDVGSYYEFHSYVLINKEANIVAEQPVLIKILDENGGKVWGRY